ncbi:cystathionine gamma-synthase-like [Tubulanus polymorphus]|uniref:cystathionine gamma-synthase-like n=1 Tax=Tubulanus polymorphus TaxID=672921 RepID=UPI003DA2E524
MPLYSGSSGWDLFPAQSNVKAGELGDASLESIAVASRLKIRQTEPIDSLATPIYHSATYRMNSSKEFVDLTNKAGYTYSRLGNPTCDTVECIIADIEGGAGSLVVSSGMAASTTVLLNCLKPGDHLVACHPIYSGVESFIQTFLASIGVEYDWVRGDSIEDYRNKIKPNTKLLYGETPCNPMVTVTDLGKFADLGKEHGILTAVDATFASPYIQQPIKHGVDIVIHSCSKYIGGHSDVVAGCITFASEEIWKQNKILSIGLGNVLSPFDAYLLIRGLKTLPLRMERHSSNALYLAKMLEKHPKISKVNYPGLETNPQHETAKKQMNGFSGMISFEMKGGFKAAEKVVDSVKLIHLAVSLGGVESLIEHPVSMTHPESGIPPGLLRFSVGIEDPVDLERDLIQAFDKVD